MLSLLRVSLSDMLAALHGFSSAPSSIGCLQGTYHMPRNNAIFFPELLKKQDTATIKWHNSCYHRLSEQSNERNDMSSITSSAETQAKPNGSTAKSQRRRYIMPVVGNVLSRIILWTGIIVFSCIGLGALMFTTFYPSYTEKAEYLTNAAWPVVVLSIAAIAVVALLRRCNVLERINVNVLSWIVCCYMIVAGTAWAIASDTFPAYDSLDLINAAKELGTDDMPMWNGWYMERYPYQMPFVMVIRLLLEWWGMVSYTLLWSSSTPYALGPRHCCWCVCRVSFFRQGSGHDRSVFVLLSAAVPVLYVCIWQRPLIAIRPCGNPLASEVHGSEYLASLDLCVHGYHRQCPAEIHDDCRAYGYVPYLSSPCDGQA